MPRRRTYSPPKLTLEERRALRATKAQANAAARVKRVLDRDEALASALRRGQLGRINPNHYKP